MSAYPVRARCWKIAATALLAVNLGACSVVQGWFPDKQKEYRFSSEIPPLEIPPDLIGAAQGQAGVNDVDAAPEPPAKSAAKPRSAPAAQAAAAPKKEESPLADSLIGKYRPAPPGAEQSATLAQDSNGAHIAIEAPFANAWTMVEKALNRLFVEVKDKDRSQKTLLVYYGEDAKPFKPSWTDDLLSPFRGGKTHEDEREYQVRLEDVGDLLTKVRVFNAAGQAQSQGEGYKLLQAIHGKILTLDKPEPKSENLRPENEESDDEDSAP